MAQQQHGSSSTDGMSEERKTELFTTISDLLVDAPSLDAGELSHVANFLLRSRFVLTASELHQELLDSGQGAHDVKILHDIFGSDDALQMFLHALEPPHPSVPGSVMPAPKAPFIAGSTKELLEKKDSELAVLGYRLRVASAEIQELKDKLAKSPAIAAAATAAAAALQAPVSASARAKQPMGPPQEHEKALLNCMVKQYLMKLGFKLTAISFAEEVKTQDLDDLKAVGLQDGQNSDLIALLRNRIAPLRDAMELEKQLAEARLSQQKLRDEIAAKETKLAEVQEQLGRLHKALGGKKIMDMFSHSTSASSVVSGGAGSGVVDDDAHSVASDMGRTRHRQDSDARSHTSRRSSFRHERKADGEGLVVQAPRPRAGSADTTPAAQAPAVAAPAAAPQAAPAPAAEGTPTGSQPSATPTPSSGLGSPSPTVSSPSPIAAPTAAATAAANSEVLFTLSSSLPGLVKNFATKERMQLLPLFVAAISYHPDPLGRAALLQSMLTLVKHPSAADREKIVEALDVIASHLGVSTTENELLAQAMALSAAGKEKRAMAALMCGILAGHVTERRADSLIATFVRLQHDTQALVRASVAQGSAYLAVALRKNKTGESARQYGEVQETLWQLLTHDEDPDVCEAAGTRLLPSLIMWSHSMESLWLDLLPHLMSCVRAEFAAADAQSLTATPSRGAAAPPRRKTTFGIAADDGKDDRLDHRTPVRAVRLEKLAPMLKGIAASASSLRACILADGYNLTNPNDKDASNAYELRVIDGDVAAAADRVQYMAQILESVFSGGVDVVVGHAEGSAAPAADGTVAAPRVSSWTKVPGNTPVLLQWLGLRAVVRCCVFSLLEIVANMDRNLPSECAVSDAVAETLSQLCGGFGPEFTFRCVAPPFFTAFNIPTPASQVAAGRTAHWPAASVIAGPVKGVQADQTDPNLRYLQGVRVPETGTWWTVLPEAGWLRQNQSQVARAVVFREGSLLPVFASAVLINLRPADAEWFVEQLVTRICTDDGGWNHTTHRALLEEFMSRVAKVGTEWLSLLLAVLGRLSQSSTSPTLLKGVLELFDALVPSISGTQAWTVLEAGVRLMKNGDAAVAAAAVRTVVSLFGVTRQAELVDRMKLAVTEVTAHGPRQSIVDVLNAFARYIPSMEPPVANQFVLKLLSDLAERIAAAIAAGVHAEREIRAVYADKEMDIEMQLAAEMSAKSARAAAIQGAEPWTGAKDDDLRPVAMAVIDCLQAFVALAPPTTVANRVGAAAKRLLQDVDLGLPAEYKEHALRVLSPMNIASLPNLMLGPNALGLPVPSTKPKDRPTAAASTPSAAAAAPAATGPAAAAASGAAAAAGAGAAGAGAGAAAAAAAVGAGGSHGAPPAVPSRGMGLGMGGLNLGVNKMAAGLRNVTADMTHQMTKNITFAKRPEDQ